MPARVFQSAVSLDELILLPAELGSDLGEVLNQDIELVAAVQRGSKSRGFRGPLWSEQEQRVRHFHRELDRYIPATIRHD